MSTAFRDFLQQRAEKHYAEVTAGKAQVDEWRASIQQLFAQLQAWLKESDTKGVIEIKENKQEITEKVLGTYSVPRLDLRILGKWIGIIPKARNTVATATPPMKSAPQRAVGRIDITDEVRRYVLYRFQESGQDFWMIDGLENHLEASEPRPGEVRVVPRYEPRPLDQAAFEKALMSYLQ